jgi:hypothetical protein
MAELISGRIPRMNFNFYGFDAGRRGYAREAALSA